MEVALRRSLHAAGLRFRKHYKSLPGCPDIVFVKDRVVVFVDGDYWHGRVLVEGGRSSLETSLKTKNRAFWIGKITANVLRDRRVSEELQQGGWTVLRFWEQDLKRDLGAAVTQILETLGRQRKGRD